MNKEKIIKSLKQMTERPTYHLDKQTLRLFNTIIQVIDERDFYIEKCNNLEKQIKKMIDYISSLGVEK